MFCVEESCFVLGEGVSLVCPLNKTKLIRGEIKKYPYDE